MLTNTLFDNYLKYQNAKYYLHASVGDNELRCIVRNNVPIAAIRVLESLDDLNKIIGNPKNAIPGRYLFNPHDNVYICCDNRDFNAILVEFNTMRQALAYLAGDLSYQGEYEVLP
jgi:hypothetical protein